MQAKLEQKRLEHERQRELQKKAFEEQVSLSFTSEESIWRDGRDRRNWQERGMAQRTDGRFALFPFTSSARTHLLPDPSSNNSPSIHPLTLRHTLPRSLLESPCLSLHSVKQMKQLELQQQAEEQALLAASGGSPASSSNGGSSKHNGPVRSRSGNDLAGFGAAAAASAAAASAKSMPGSRRHSGELKDGKEEKEGGARRGHVQDKEGKPMLNSFLFDDELDADLQSKSAESLLAALVNI